MAIEIKHIIKKTMTAELMDGRIVEIAIPFSLPDGMTLLAPESHASLGNTNRKQLADQPEMATAPG